VVHKHHIIAPKISAMKGFLPKDSILEGNQLLLGSIRTKLIENPEFTMFRIWRAYYWHELLSGRSPPAISLDLDRLSSTSGGEIREPNISDFLHIWQEAGFTFENQMDYSVIRDRVQTLDHMSLGFTFKNKLEVNQFNELIGMAILSQPKLLKDDISMEEFLDHLRCGSGLPNKVADRLHRYVEADSYIKYEFSREKDFPEVVFLISRDQRLAIDLARIAMNNKSWREKATNLLLVDPWVYQYGCFDLVTDDKLFVGKSTKTIVDFGSVNYNAFTADPIVDWPEGPVTLVPSRRHQHVFFVKLQGSTSGEKLSLTTQLPSQYGSSSWDKSQDDRSTL